MPDRKVFLVQAAVVSRLSEGVLADLLQDPRVGQTYGDVWQSLAEEMLWRVSLPSHVWSALAKVTDITGAALQSRCINAGHAAWHFFYRRVLAPAAGLPWSLRRGDIAANLQDLKDDVTPEEPLSNQLWQLMNVVRTLTRLTDTVKLLGQVPWATLPCEQLHGSLAVFRRWHPEFGLVPLVPRALMMQFSRVIVPIGV